MRDPAFLMPPYDRLATLLQAGKKDAAVLHYVAETDFVLPWEMRPLDPGPDCVILLDHNLPWCAAPQPLAERCLRLVREGKLRLEVRGFIPNHLSVLTGEKAVMLPFGQIPLSGLPDARRQPSGGYRHPHRAIAFLRPAGAEDRPNGQSNAFSRRAAVGRTGNSVAKPPQIIDK